MRILVTGATGFLGKYIVEELRNDYELIAFGRNKNKGNKLEGKYVKFVSGDFTNYDEINQAMKDVDMVVHAGALSTVWGKWDDFYKINVLGTENVVKSALENKVKKLVFVSSPSIYTDSTDRLNIKENEVNVKNELNFYIKSKIMAETIINDSKKHGLNAVIIRPRGLLGVGDPSMLPRIIKANKKIGIPLMNDGKNLVDITCVENVALAIRLCLEKEIANGKTYNITNGEPREFKQILEELFSEMGIKPKYKKFKFETIFTIAGGLERLYKIFKIYDEPPLTQYTVATLGHSQTLNIDKAKNDLGYEVKITLSEGIKNYAKEIKKSDC